MSDSSNAVETLEDATLPNPNGWTRSEPDTLIVTWDKQVQDASEYPYDGAHDYDGDDPLVLQVRLSWHDGWFARLLVHEHPDELLSPHLPDAKNDVTFDEAIEHINMFLETY